MSKLCIIYNFSQRYREGIFKRIDQEWDCKWYFGNNKTDIKGFDEGVLRDITYVRNRFLYRDIYWQTGVSRLIAKKVNAKFLMLGEPMCISSWWIMIQRRLFFRKKRVYLWTHGWYGRENLLKKWLKRIYFGLADHVFTYGDYAKKVAISQGFKSEKITPIHNSLDYDAQIKLRNKLSASTIYNQYFGNTSPTLIFIGRLTKSKKLNMILSALKILKDKGAQYNLVLIGGGEDFDNLKTMVNKLGLSRNVWFYGPSYDESINAELIYNADLCVSPGNVGLTAIHSMTFGTPVITHSHFPNQGPEFEAIRAGLTGAFFPENSIEGLVIAIDKWFGMKQNRDEIRKACYNEIDTSWNPDYQMTVLKSILQ